MDTTIILVILTLFLFLFLAMAFLLLTSRSSGLGGTIPIPEGEGPLTLKVEQGAGGVSIRFVYGADGMRQSDAELVPEIKDDTPIPQDALDRAFWQRVANIDLLPPTEKVETLHKLAVFGFIKKSDIATFDVPEDHPDMVTQDDIKETGTEPKMSEPETKMEEEKDPEKPADTVPLSRTRPLRHPEEPDEPDNGDDDFPSSRVGDDAPDTDEDDDASDIPGNEFNRGFDE